LDFLHWQANDFIMLAFGGWRGLWVLIAMVLCFMTVFSSKPFVFIPDLEFGEKAYET